MSRQLHQTEKAALEYIAATPEVCNLLKELAMLPEDLDDEELDWSRALLLARWHQAKFSEQSKAD